MSPGSYALLIKHGLIVMANPGGSNCATPELRTLQNTSPETDLTPVIDDKKRKRMQSNRESARRSRMRKQKQMDDLQAQVNKVTHENSLIQININSMTQHYLNTETENTILRAQLAELTNRLYSVLDIIAFSSPSRNEVFQTSHHFGDTSCQLLSDVCLEDPFHLINQFIVASAHPVSNY